MPTITSTGWPGSGSPGCRAFPVRFHQPDLEPVPHMVDDAHRLVGAAAGGSSASEKAPRSPGRHRMRWTLLLLCALALIARVYVTGGPKMSADDHADVRCQGFRLDPRSLGPASGS